MTNKHNNPSNRKGNSIHDFNGNNSNNNNNNNTGGLTNPSANAQALINQANLNGQNNIDDTPDVLINYNDAAANGDFSEAFFRDKQIGQIVRTLKTKKKPNALLIGDAGVGKTQLVEEIARRIVNNDPIIAHDRILKDKVIYELPLSSLVSGSGIVGQLEEKVEDVVNFAKDPDNNAIIFIDEIHQLMAGKSDPSYDKIAQILKPALDRGSMTVIGATTTQEAKTLLSDPAYNRRFNDVFIPELSTKETEQVIFNIKQQYQNHHNVTLSDDLIEKVVRIGDEHKQYGSHRPDTSITLLDKAMADAQLTHVENLEKAKTDPIIDMFVKQYPVPKLTEKRLKESALTLLTGDDSLLNNDDNLENDLESNIIGQQVVKDDISDAVKRLNLGLIKRTKPTSFLFAGQTGTGKSEIAKIMANAIFGGEQNMISINMSEYSSEASLTRITGSSAGYIGSDSKRELPFDTLETNPYQLILLDEFEKAHPTVQQFFMQALDEGEVKSNNNSTIDFRRTMIVATTNAGVVELSKDPVGFQTEDNQTPQHTENDIINILKDNIAVEILNRFEFVAPFTSINKKQYTEILAVKYNQMISEMQENRQDLILKPDYISIEDATSNQVLNDLADKSYSPSRNGRPAENTVRKYIEDVLLNDTNATQFNLL